MHTNRRILSVAAAFLLFVTFGAAETPGAVLAVSPTPTAAATPSATPAGTAQLDALKERLATKVAELRSVVKRAMNGVVKTVSVASATVETDTKDIKIELGDNVKVAQMIRGKRTELTTDDLAKDDPITVFGTYDETLDLLKAQYIFIENKTPLQHVSGSVTASDEKAFTVSVKTREGRVLTIDIEKDTKTSVWTKADGIAKAGFSKIAEGDTVHVTGTDVAGKENRIRALRILDLGNLSGAAPTPTPEASASASSTP